MNIKRLVNSDKAKSNSEYYVNIILKSADALME